MALVRAAVALSVVTDAQTLVIYSDGLGSDCLRVAKDSGQQEESKGQRPNWNLGSRHAVCNSVT